CARWSAANFDFW
nr:immunoglobulin heavy chain junction region [Macaca mulatta]